MSHVSRDLQGDVSLTIKTNYQVTSRGNGCGEGTRQPNFTLILYNVLLLLYLDLFINSSIKVQFYEFTIYNWITSSYLYEVYNNIITYILVGFISCTLIKQIRRDSLLNILNVYCTRGFCVRSILFGNH